jgi:hypothetical protein
MQVYVRVSEAYVGKVGLFGFQKEVGLRSRNTRVSPSGDEGLVEVAYTLINTVSN